MVGRRRLAPVCRLFPALLLVFVVGLWFGLVSPGTKAAAEPLARSGMASGYDAGPRSVFNAPKRLSNAAPKGVVRGKKSSKQNIRTAPSERSISLIKRAILSVSLLSCTVRARGFGFSLLDKFLGFLFFWSGYRPAASSYLMRCAQKRTGSLSPREGGAAGG